MSEIDTATYRWKLEKAKTVFITEAVYEFHADSSGMVGGDIPTLLWDVFDNSSEFEGKTCVVEWDGVRYACTISPFGNTYMIGNLSVMGGDDTGEPFIMSLGGDDTALVIALDGITSHTITAYIEGTEIQLVSIGKNDNPLTTLEGGIVNGVFENARYQLAKAFKLLHDKDWALEWRMSGDVAQSSEMAKIWDESGKQTDKESESILFRKTTKSITLTSFGSVGSSSATHIHHGVQLDKYGIDYTAEHIYRLQNKVNADGTNMVYLYVDGKEIAPMTHTFYNGGDEGNTNWVVGRDFSFGYMGVPRYIMTGFIMDDIAVWESGASEVFPETVPYDETSFQIGLIMGLLSGNGEPNVTPSDTFDADSFNKGYAAGRSLR